MSDLEDIETPWDVVIVGHGFAGLSAAKSYLETAAAAGRTTRVALLEQAPESSKGGSTAWTTAFFRLDNEGRFNLDTPMWRASECAS